MWNDGNQFKCSFAALFNKFDKDYIHYTSTEYDTDAPLIKKIISEKSAPKSKVRTVIRIRNIFKEINPSGYTTNFFNNIPHNARKTKSTEIPEFSMVMIFSLLMYKYSFGRKESTASDVSCSKLCECMNCYTELISRNTFVQDIDKRDIYKAQCFIEKYLLNLIYNINSIVKYSSCNFASDKIRESYRSRLIRNRYILTYQKLCSLQNSVDIDITYFMESDILNEYIDIVTYMLALMKASSIASYQNIINSFKLYLVNDSQSPMSLIPRKIYMKDNSSDLSADNYAKIFDFNYYNTPKKRNKRYSKSSHTCTKSKASTTESTTPKSLAEKFLEYMENSKKKNKMFHVPC